MSHKLYLYNSISGKKEEFKPIDSKNIRLYVCGPTVYSLPHIGNARSTIIYDILYRLLKYLYPKVTYVRNITDIDDKIIDAANEREVSIAELTKEITNEFHKDMEYLGNLTPDIEPKATENIKDIIEMIQKLIANKNAYEVHGHVYFSVNTFKDYGKLSKRVDGLKIGARVGVVNLKKDQKDFVLWKPSKDDEDKSARFKSPWGYGRPGWHIECSVMSSKYLGDNFDIHGGGADLKFPHHENEIAQSRALDPHSHYAKYWVHNGFLTVNGEKMSKSLGNFITIRDLINKDISGVSLRYLLLSTNYRKPLDYNQKNLDDANKKIRLYQKIYQKYANNQLDSNELPKDFLEPLLDDLNIAKSLAYLHKLAKEIDSNSDDISKISYFVSIIKFLALDNFDFKETISDDILKLVEEITEARNKKDYDLADKIRDKLSNKGYKLSYDKSGKIKIDLI